MCMHYVETGQWIGSDFWFRDVYASWAYFYGYVSFTQHSMMDSKSYSCSPSHALNCMKISKTVDEHGQKSFLDTCFGAEASKIEHQCLEVASGKTN